MLSADGRLAERFSGWAAAVGHRQVSGPTVEGPRLVGVPAAIHVREGAGTDGHLPEKWDCAAALAGARAMMHPPAGRQPASPLLPRSLVGGVHAVLDAAVLLLEQG